MPRVLIAEDEPDHAAIARRALERLGVEVEVVADGEAALRRLLDPAASAVDLLLADVRMPRRDGVELTRAVRAVPRLHDLPIVLVSSSDDPEDLRRVEGAGADAFVPKTGVRTYGAALAALPAAYLSPLRRRYSAAR